VEWIKNKRIYIVAFFIAIFINVFSWHLPFFWDTILTSTITQYFYENGFQNFIPPAQWDAGHPTLFYVYITMFYKIFGRDLIVAHFAMLPFLFLLSYSFILLMRQFSFSLEQQLFGIILLFSIPAVLTQSTLISYDIVLLSLYLSALVAYFKNKKFYFMFILIGMMSITLRGVFGAFALSITIYFLEDRKIKNWFNWNLFLLPGFILFIAWSFFHFKNTGWYFSTNSTAWANQRGIVDVNGFIKNILSIVRCYIDMGIIVLSVCFFWSFLKFKISNKLFIISFVPLIFFSISFLPFTNPINHRYFLIVYVLMLLPILLLLKEIKFVYKKIIVFLLVLGHFQIYPIPISNAWDCTLTYISYAKCMDDFYLHNSKYLKINSNKIGSVFPMVTSLKQTHLLEDTTRLVSVHAQSIDLIPYVLFSNIGNDFSDEQIQQLKNWNVVSQYNSYPIELILYQNPKIPSK